MPKRTILDYKPLYFGQRQQVRFSSDYRPAASINWERLLCGDAQFWQYVEVVDHAGQQKKDVVICDWRLHYLGTCYVSHIKQLLHPDSGFRVFSFYQGKCIPIRKIDDLWRVACEPATAAQALRKLVANSPEFNPDQAILLDHFEFEKIRAFEAKEQFEYELVVDNYQLKEKNIPTLELLQFSRFQHLSKVRLSGIPSKQEGHLLSKCQKLYRMTLYLKSDDETVYQIPAQIRSLVFYGRAKNLPKLNRGLKTLSLSMGSACTEISEPLPVSLEWLTITKSGLKRLPSLSRCSQLKKLFIEGNRVLTRLPNYWNASLEEISLIGKKNCRDQGYWWKLSNFPKFSSKTKVKTVTLEGVGFGRSSWPKVWPSSLSSLEVKGCDMVVSPCFHSSSKVSVLKLSYIFNLTFPYKTWPDSLETINLSYVKFADRQVFPTFSKGSKIKKLKILDFKSLTSLKGSTISGVPCLDLDLQALEVLFDFPSNTTIKSLSFKWGKQVKAIPRWWPDSLEDLEVTSYSLVNSPEFSSRSKIKSIDLYGFKDLPSFWPEFVEKIVVRNYHKNLVGSKFAQFSNFSEISPLAHFEVECSQRNIALPTIWPSALRTLKICVKQVDRWPAFSQDSQLDSLDISINAFKCPAAFPRSLKCLRLITTVDADALVRALSAPLDSCTLAADLPVACYSEFLNKYLKKFPGTSLLFKYSSRDFEIQTTSEVELLVKSCQAIRKKERQDLLDFQSSRKRYGYGYGVGLYSAGSSGYPSSSSLSPEVSPSSGPILDPTDQPIKFDKNTHVNPSIAQSADIYIKTAVGSIHPRRYREGVNDSFSITENGLMLSRRPSVEIDEKLSKVLVSPMVIKQVKKVDDALLDLQSPYSYWVCTAIKLSSLGWQPLPGLFPTDQITHFEKNDAIEIRFNQHYWQYEARLKSGRLSSTQSIRYLATTRPLQPIKLKPKLMQLTLTISRTLQQLLKPNQAYPKAFNKLRETLVSDQVVHKKYSAIVDYLKDYANKAIAADGKEDRPSYMQPFAKSDPNLQDFLQSLIEAKGSCHHRAVAFFALCSFVLKWPTAVSYNKIHEQAWCFDPKKGWVGVELGGAEANLSLNTSAFSEKGAMDEVRLEEVAPPNDQWVPPIKVKKDNPWVAYFLPSKQHFSKSCRSAPALFAALESRQRILIYTQDRDHGREIYQAYYQYNQTSSLLSSRSERKHTGHRDVFYIESPNDFRRYFEMFNYKTNKHSLGPLKKVLQSNHGVLVINWAQFKAEQIGAYKSLLDDPPTFPRLSQGGAEDKGSLPLCIAKGLKIINLYPPEVGASPAFISRVPIDNRFDWPSQCSVSTPTPSLGKEEKGLPIDLYADPGSWSSDVLGQVGVDNDKFTFTPSPAVNYLARRSENKPTLLLQDCPDDIDFAATVFRMQTEKRCYADGRKTTFHPSADIILMPPSTGFNSRAQSLETDIGLSFKRPLYINRNNFATLFRSVLFYDQGEKKGQAEPTDGLLENKPDCIILTEKLIESQQRRLETHPSAAKLPIYQLAAPDQFRRLADPPHKNRILVSEDPAFTSSIAAANESKALVIQLLPMTEYSDLVVKNELVTRHPLRFKRINRPLLIALEAGQHVVLQGVLTRSLYHQLETLFSAQPHLLINQEKRPMKGRLEIHAVSFNYKPGLAFNTGTYEAQSLDDLWQAYEQEIKRSFKSQLDNFYKLKTFYRLASLLPHGQVGMPLSPRVSFHKLVLMLKALSKPSKRQNPIKDFILHDYDHQSEAYAYLNVIAKLLFGPDKGGKIRTEKRKQWSSQPGFQWRIANTLSAADLRGCWLITSDKPLDDLLQENKIELSEKAWKKLRSFTPKSLAEEKHSGKSTRKKREARAMDYLKAGHFVFLKGPPGSGKTYFAEHIPASSRHWGIEQLESWVEADSKRGDPILIIDEANMTEPGTWAFFSALQQGRDTFEYQGKSYKISKNHKVIFTGNPEYYSQDRHYHPFLQDCPTVYFNRWSDQELRDSLLAPLLRQSAIKLLVKDSELLFDSVIKAYRDLQQCSLKGRVSIRDLIQLVTHILYRLGKSKGSDDGKAIIEHTCCELLDSQWLSKSLVTDEKFIDHLKKACFVSSQQQPLMTRLQETVELSLWRTEQKLDDAASLGKNALLLEGDSGIGKSTILPHLFAYTHPGKQVLQITISDDMESLEKTLLTAFHQGLPVILDELNLNLARPLEALLNHLLTGRTPQGGLAQLPGFFVAATQNTRASAGRKTLSPSLLNRFKVIDFSTPTRDDSIEFAQQARRLQPKNQRLSDAALEQMVDGFWQAQQQDNEVNLRNFFQHLKQWPSGCIQTVLQDLMSQIEKHVFVTRSLFPSEIILPNKQKKMVSGSAKAIYAYIHKHFMKTNTGTFKETITLNDWKAFKKFVLAKIGTKVSSHSISVFRGRTTEQLYDVLLQKLELMPDIEANVSYANSSSSSVRGFDS